jgi:adenosine deaminase
MDEKLTFEVIKSVPKVLLHDHLDGGVRPSTVAELAVKNGYKDLPTTDPVELAKWFRQAKYKKSCF